MNFFIFILSVIWTFAAFCSTSQQEVQDSFSITHSVVEDSIAVDAGDKSSETVFYVRDSSLYSAIFLQEFRKTYRAYKEVALLGDTILINNEYKNIITIPVDLPLNQIVEYVRIDKDKSYTLFLKRVNVSSLEYVYYESEGGREINQEQGTADLEALFYLRAEAVFEDESGNSFGMNAYIDASGRDCPVHICVGKQNIEKSFLYYACSDGIRTPELIRKK